ncbi:hypothetical protein GPECTOR_30g198 [Gonium pectorale]|uniref:Guanylate cyclase domain-containing protein n=1 Tax=Gonium pectorale TaxID=33097 RepID=A0A150GE95_GONPE|nr:hypothetical protein GPECTOR_30g198 [Gonium pectorale]|eukprot:KXZ48103.1 hypothetical protein GPECTOR_30g198 [Gonium pectorale]
MDISACAFDAVPHDEGPASSANSHVTAASGFDPLATSTWGIFLEPARGEGSPAAALSRNALHATAGGMAPVRPTTSGASVAVAAAARAQASALRRLRSSVLDSRALSSPYPEDLRGPSRSMSISGRSHPPPHRNLQHNKSGGQCHLAVSGPAGGHSAHGQLAAEAGGQEHGTQHGSPELCAVSEGPAAEEDGAQGQHGSPACRSDASHTASSGQNPSAVARVVAFAASLRSAPPGSAHIRLALSGGLGGAVRSNNDPASCPGEDAAGVASMQTMSAVEFSQRSEGLSIQAGATGVGRRSTHSTLDFTRGSEGLNNQAGASKDNSAPLKGFMLPSALSRPSLQPQIFPRHVLAHMTEEGGPWNVLGQRPAAPAACKRPVGRDPHKLATSHDEVTLLFADVEGFTPMCKVLEPHVVMAFLDELYTRFDSRLDTYGVYKVETIGDCYFVAGGLIHEDEEGTLVVRKGAHTDPRHAERVFSFAKAMLAAAAETTLPTTGGPVRMRIGIHSGPVVSGVVGQRMPRFCLFDSLNPVSMPLAPTSRMESTGVPGCIHASEAAHAHLRNEEWVPTGGIEVKGKGRMRTYLWAPPDAGSQALLDRSALVAGRRSEWCI